MEEPSHPKYLVIPEEALSELGEAARKIASLLAVRSHSDEVHVTRHGKIFIQGATEPVEVQRLIRIVNNASSNAGVIFDYLVGNKDTGNTERRRRISAERMAATIRDSFGSMAALFGHQDDDQAIQPWRWEKQKPVDEALASIYMGIKSEQVALRAFNSDKAHKAATQLQAAMDTIKEEE